MKRVEHYAPVEEDGRFSLTLSLPEPTEVWLVAGGQQQALLLSPHDTLQLELDWKEWQAQGGAALRFGGPIADRQRQLRELEQAFAKKFPAWEKTELLALSPEEMLSMVHNRQNREITFWRSWHLTDPVLRAYAEQRAFLSAPRQLFRYALRRQAPEAALSPAPEFFRFWPHVLGQQAISANTFALQQISAAYANYLNLTVPEKMPDLPEAAEERLPRIVRAQARELAGASLPRAMRDRLLTMVLGNSLGFPLLAPGVDTIAIQAIQTPFLRKLTREKYDQIRSPSSAEIFNGNEVIVPDTITSLTRFLHRQFPDKVIVVDFWGTWCTPCISTMQNILPGWRKQLPADDVILVFVALDSPRPIWVRQVNQLPFQAYHLLLDRSFDPLVAREFGARTLPHYSIIDPAGRIVVRQAKAPEQGLLAQIQALF